MADKKVERLNDAISKVEKRGSRQDWDEYKAASRDFGRKR